MSSLSVILKNVDIHTHASNTHIHRHFHGFLRHTINTYKPTNQHFQTHMLYHLSFTFDAPRIYDRLTSPKSFIITLILLFLRLTCNPKHQIPILVPSSFIIIASFFPLSHPPPTHTSGMTKAPGTAEPLRGIRPWE